MEIFHNHCVKQFGRQIIIAVLLCFAVPTSHAASELAQMDIGAITGPGWRIDGVSLALSDFADLSPNMVMTAKTLTFPKPFHDLKLADIRCGQFIWHGKSVECRQGKASVNSHYWQSPSLRFAFQWTGQGGWLKCFDGRFAGSKFSLQATRKGRNWQVHFELGPTSPSFLSPWLPADAVAQLKQLKKGRLQLKGTMTGTDSKPRALTLNARMDEATGESDDGKIAMENIAAFMAIRANNHGTSWHWQSEAQINQGAVYYDPVYVAVSHQPITLAAQGMIDLAESRVNIASWLLDQPEVAFASGTAMLSYRESPVIDSAELKMESHSSQKLMATYLYPFLTSASPDNLTMTGKLAGKATIIQHSLTKAALSFAQLNATDPGMKLAIKDGNGTLNWSQDEAHSQQSLISWKSLSIKDIPVGAATMHFSSQGNHFALADTAHLPLLEGEMAIDKFRWRPHAGEEGNVSFAGRLEHLSLASLSSALGWTPLTGELNGVIPGVTYKDKTLSLDGELVINVFDGAIKISQLKSSGLFSYFARLESEIEFDHLDLAKLTGKFQFGAMTGRLSGYVKNLILENWQPITFYAWFGTPEDDDSSHWISQKAVKNIASIGGGGASDLLSRSFLSFFESFRYDQIGMGCYLHQGACQLMGLEAKDNGYYLIKGGWLPRIDVLGYNPRVNWDVLVERLKRVTSPEQAIIE